MHLMDNIVLRSSRLLDYMKSLDCLVPGIFLVVVRHGEAVIPLVDEPDCNTDTIGAIMSFTRMIRQADKQTDRHFISKEFEEIP